MAYATKRIIDRTLKGEIIYEACLCAEHFATERPHDLTELVKLRDRRSPWGIFIDPESALGISVGVALLQPRTNIDAGKGESPRGDPIRDPRHGRPTGRLGPLDISPARCRIDYASVRRGPRRRH